VITIQDIIWAIPSLNRKELETVKKTVQYHLGKKASSNSIEEEDWLLAGLLAELRRRGIANKGDGFRIKKLSSFASFQTKSIEIRSLLEESAPSLNIIERKYLGEIAAYELANYITWYDISLNVLLENINLIPLAIEKSFPGYMSSKMLGIIIQHRFK